MNKKVLLFLFLGFIQLSCGSEENKLIDLPNEEHPGNEDEGTDKPEPENPVLAISWYVSPTGNDSNDGTKDRPFQTVGKALQRANPSDTVFLREGEYHEFVYPPTSGKKGKEITIKGYKNEVAKIDGTGLDIKGWGNALLKIQDVSYITVENLHICNAVNTEKNTDSEGVFISGNSNYVTLRGCEIYNIKNTCTRSGQDAGGDWRSAHAILVGGYDMTPIRGLVVENCDIHDIHSGTSETFSLVGNVTDFKVCNNEVHDVENIGIIVAGGDNLNPSGDVSVNYARDGVVSGNKVYRCSHQNSTEYWGENGYGAIGIYVCGGAGTIIEQNEVWGCDRAIGLVSESDILPTKNCIVRNNLVYNNYRTGIYMGDYIGYTIGGTSGCYILNNTLFNNNQVGGSLDGSNNLEHISDIDDSEGEIRLTSNCTNNTVMNNVIYAVTDRDIFIRKYNKTGSNNKVDYNLYYSPTDTNRKWIWDGVLYTSFEAWQRVSGDEHSLFGEDPKLKKVDRNTPDFHLLSGSPARNAGFFAGLYLNGVCDFEGAARYSGSSISIGAYQ